MSICDMNFTVHSKIADSSFMVCSIIVYFSKDSVSSGFYVNHFWRKFCFAFQSYKFKWLMSVYCQLLSFIYGPWFMIKCFRLWSSTITHNVFFFHYFSLHYRQLKVAQYFGSKDERSLLRPLVSLFCWKTSFRPQIDPKPNSQNSRYGIWLSANIDSPCDAV